MIRLVPAYVLLLRVLCHGPRLKQGKSIKQQLCCLLAFADVVQRSQLEGQRKADFQALAAAKRSGNLAIVSFTLELPAELADVELPEKNGIIEVPMTGDVPMLKRLFMYQAHNKLLPALQVRGAAAKNLSLCWWEIGGQLSSCRVQGVSLT